MSAHVVARVAAAGTGPTSEMISRWHDHTSRMASGVPMPAPRGSPAGPNQWFCGAPVVRARRPAYVVPLTVLPSTCARRQGMGRVQRQQPAGVSTACSPPRRLHGLPQRTPAHAGTCMVPGQHGRRHAWCTRCARCSADCHGCGSHPQVAPASSAGARITLFVSHPRC